MGKYTKKKPIINTAVASQPRTGTTTVSDAEDYLQLRSRRLHKTTYQPNPRRRTQSSRAAAPEVLSSSPAKDSERKKRSTRETTPCSSNSSSFKNHISVARNITVPQDLDAEVEEFLTRAEESLQCHYLDKYNFDFENGVPMLGGRYEWMVVRP